MEEWKWTAMDMFILWTPVVVMFIFVVVEMVQKKGIKHFWRNLKDLFF